MRESTSVAGVIITTAIEHGSECTVELLTMEFSVSWKGVLRLPMSNPVKGVRPFASLVTSHMLN